MKATPEQKQRAEIEIAEILPKFQSFTVSATKNTLAGLTALLANGGVGTPMTWNKLLQKLLPFDQEITAFKKRFYAKTITPSRLKKLRRENKLFLDIL